MSIKKVAVRLVRSNKILFALAKRIKNGGRKKVDALSPATVYASGFSLKEFRHLIKLRNFKSAAELLKGGRAQELNLSDRILAIRCLYGVGSGVPADDLLEVTVRETLEQKGGKARQLAELVECVRLSGLNYERKEHLINCLREGLEEFPGSEAEKFRVSISLFRLRESVDVSTPVLDYIDVSECSEAILAECSRVFHLLFSYGYHTEVYDYLNRCLNTAASIDLLLVRLVIKFMPEWFDDHHGVLERVVSGNKDNVALLQTLYGHRRERDYFERAFTECFDAVMSGFAGSDLYRKDTILRFLLRCDLWDEAHDLVENTFVPDSVIPKLVIRGFRYLNLGDYGASLHCFQSALEEDPSDGYAAGGLRFAMPRAGLGMRAILELRGRIGYGIDSAGRRGLLKSGGEYSTSEIMAGNYLTSFYSRKNLRQWQILGQILGGRFYSYQFLPAEARHGRIYIIADEGVGDEIRASQFYGFLQENYENVVASCDPRLINIFSKTFPKINFLPVRRVRKIMATRSDTLNARLVGVHDSVSRYFNDETYAEMQRADYVLFGQNLMFYRFSGAIPRPASGGYLKWERSPRISNAPGKLKIGILWRSHLMVRTRKLMYLRLEDFSPLTQLEGVEIWSIQHAMTEAETQTCRDLGINLLDDVDLFNDFEGMASCLLGLDLLIGISSVPMELGAALGIETWMLGFSPENYYLRTAGGKTEVDQLTLNSTVVAPPWIDFTEPQEVCVREVFDEVKRRLAPRLAAIAGADGQVYEG